MPRRILITGGGGFVGCHVAFEAVLGQLRQADEDLVVSVDRMVPPTYGNKSVSMDLTDVEAVTEMVHSMQPTHVVHCAGVTYAETVDVYLEGNVRSTHVLLRALADVGRKSLQRFVNVSSAAVLGATGPGDCPVSEDHPRAPSGTYGWSKMVQERIVEGFGHNWGLPVVNARVFNTCGPGQRPTMMPAALFRRFLVEDGPELPVRNWSATRDYLDVRDIASALLVLMDRGDPGTTYNVGSGVAKCIGALSRMAAKAAGTNKAPIPGAVDSPRDCSCADVSRLTALGWSPRYSLDESLADCWEWVRGIVPVQKSTDV